MKRFELRSVAEDAEGLFDRQERIAWWRQDIVRAARILVVGAGAIGNETLKNLVLLGFDRILVLDFDVIAPSNLSRTLLFRRADQNKRKAPTAAQHAREMALVDAARIHYRDADVVWDVGSGVFRRVDLVLGCLDNVEARLAVNRSCWLANTPWIDAGIHGLSGHVSVYVPPATACYACNLTKQQRAAARHRYSCDDFKRQAIAQDAVPTVQVASALASAIQVQEAVKLLCQSSTGTGHRILFQGERNEFDLIALTRNPACLAHVSHPAVTSLPLKSSCGLAEFLKYVSRPEASGPGAVLDFSGDRTFVLSGACRVCHRHVDYRRPMFRIDEAETTCADCRARGAAPEPDATDRPVDKITMAEFSLDKTPGALLGSSLHDLGVPPLHVLSVRDASGDYRYYELAGDAAELFPGW